MDSNDPGWQQPQGQPLQNYAGPRPTNPMAIAALVSSLVLAPLGIIFGHISLSQIKRTGEDGRGLAIAGLAIGYGDDNVRIHADVACPRCAAETSC